MKKLLIFLLLLSGCGSFGVAPISLINGSVFTFYGPPYGNGQSTLTLNSYGTFVLNSNWQIGWHYYNCLSAGTYRDLTPGSYNGLVQFNYTADSCNTPSLAWSTQNYNYQFSNGSFTINLIFGNQNIIF